MEDSSDTDVHRDTTAEKEGCKGCTLCTCDNPLLKAIVFGLFILSPFIGFTFGVWYGMQSDSVDTASPSAPTVIPSPSAVKPSPVTTVPPDMLFVSDSEGYAVGTVESIDMTRCAVDGACTMALDSGIRVVWGGESEIPHGAVEANMSVGDTIVAFGSVSGGSRTVAMHGDTSYFLLKTDDCFMASFEVASKPGHRALPPHSNMNRCPEGFKPNGMRCPTSLAWCEPSNPVISILEQFRVAYPNAPTMNPEPHTFTWINQDGTTIPISGYAVWVTDMSLQDLSWGDRSVLHQLESTVGEFFSSNGYIASTVNATDGPLRSVPGFASEGMHGLVCVREWKDTESEYVDYAISCGFWDSLPSEIMHRIDATETSILPENEVLLPNGVDLSTYRQERGL